MPCGIAIRLSAAVCPECEKVVAARSIHILVELLAARTKLLRRRRRCVRRQEALCISRESSIARRPQLARGVRGAVYREQATHGCGRANRTRRAAAD